MAKQFVTIDVRPMLASGQPPLPALMQAVGALPSDHGLRLLAPFRPAPLIQRLEGEGFDAAVTQLPDGGWQVDFTRVGRPLSPGSALDAAEWPRPRVLLDLTGDRGGDPLATLGETIARADRGTVIFALLDDEPDAAQLAALGHPWAGNHAHDGSGYRLLVRAGG